MPNRNRILLADQKKVNPLDVRRWRRELLRVYAFLECLENKRTTKEIFPLKEKKRKAHPRAII